MNDKIHTASPASKDAGRLISLVRTASCSLLCLTSAALLGQIEESLPDSHGIEVRFESKNYCGILSSTEWFGGAHIETERLYRLVDLERGGIVRPSQFVKPEKMESLINLLNVKLGMYVQELEKQKDDTEVQAVIEVLQKSSINQSHLDDIEFSNREWSGDHKQLTASLSCSFLWYASRALEPYLELTEQECLFFFRQELFLWQEVD